MVNSQSKMISITELQCSSINRLKGQFYRGILYVWYSDNTFICCYQVYELQHDACVQDYKHTPPMDSYVSRLLNPRNETASACKSAASPIAFISHERKQVVIQFLNQAVKEKQWKK